MEFSKVQLITKLFLQICLHLYGTRRRAALVVGVFIEVLFGVLLGVLVGCLGQFLVSTRVRPAVSLKNLEMILCTMEVLN